MPCPHGSFHGLRYAKGLKELHVFDQWTSYKILRSGGKWMKGNTLDATPAYLKLPSVAAPRIRALCRYHRPPKFMVVLCDPAERSWSHYRHRLRVLEHSSSNPDQLSRAFAEGVGDEVRALRACLPRHNYTACGDLLYGGWTAVTEHAAQMHPGRARTSSPSAGVVGGSLYTEQLQAWFEHFPREDFLVLDSRRALSDKHWLIGMVANFTGLMPNAAWASHPLPAANVNPEFSSATLRAPEDAMSMLRAFFAEREGWKRYLAE